MSRAIEVLQNLSVLHEYVGIWWMAGAAIWAVLLVVIVACCRVSGNADRAATRAFNEMRAR